MPPREEPGAVSALPLHCITEASFAAWQVSQPAAARSWLAGNHFQPERGRWSLLPDASGANTGVVVGLGKQEPADAAAWFWLAAALADRLPFARYALAQPAPAAALPFTL